MKRTLKMCMATLACGLAWSFASCGGKGGNAQNDINSNEAEAETEVNVWEGYCPDDNHPHAIDLGLPSGTKWACCNVGAEHPADFGVYFAWGETSPKDTYLLSTYKWQGPNERQMLKYDNDEYSSYRDGRSVLEPEDDAACVIMGEKWRTPTVEQALELVMNTKSSRTTFMDVDGLKQTAANGNSIFLPFSHYYSGAELFYQDTEGRYWLAELNRLSPCYASHMQINPVLNIEHGFGIGGAQDRSSGLTVRAVRN